MQVFINKVSLLLLLCFTLGCATLKFDPNNITHIESAQSEAAWLMKRWGYEVTNEPVRIIIHETELDLSTRLKLLRPYPGVYDGKNRAIHLVKGCRREVAVHEWLHHLLTGAGVPYKEHHKIMNEMGR